MWKVCQVTWTVLFNSWPTNATPNPGKSDSYLRSAVSDHILRIYYIGASCEIVLRWIRWASCQILNIADAHAPGTFNPPLQVSDPDMHHGTCLTHVPWYMPGSLTSDFLRIRWRGNRSRHSLSMRNTQFCVSGKRLMDDLWLLQAECHFLSQCWFYFAIWCH